MAAMKSVNWRNSDCQFSMTEPQKCERAHVVPPRCRGWLRGRSARRCTGAGPRRTGRRASPRRRVAKKRERLLRRGGTPSRLRQSDDEGRDQSSDDDARVEDKHRFHGPIRGRVGACTGSLGLAGTGVRTLRSGLSAWAWRSARAAFRARASTRRRRERGASRGLVRSCGFPPLPGGCVRGGRKYFARVEVGEPVLVRAHLMDVHGVEARVGELPDAVEMALWVGTAQTTLRRRRPR